MPGMVLELPVAMLLVSWAHKDHSSWISLNQASGYAIGQIDGALESKRYELLIVGAFCSFWAIVLFPLPPDSPTAFRGFTHRQRLLMVARVRRNQTGIEAMGINWVQIKEAYFDYKT